VDGQSAISPSLGCVEKPGYWLWTRFFGTRKSSKFENCLLYSTGEQSWKTEDHHDNPMHHKMLAPFVAATLETQTSNRKANLKQSFVCRHFTWMHPPPPDSKPDYYPRKFTIIITSWYIIFSSGCNKLQHTDSAESINLSVSVSHRKTCACSLDKQTCRRLMH